MKLLVVGGGGREHAIVKKLKELPSHERPGSSPLGYGGSPATQNARTFGATPTGVAFAKEEGFDYVVVARDWSPLALGLVDRLARRTAAAASRPARCSART